MIWFTADLHIGHKNVIDYCRRPFVTVDEMNEVIMDNILEFVGRGDILYILGDSGYSSGKIEALLKFLIMQGVQVHYIWGNHDDSSKIKRAINDNCVWTGDLKYITIEEQKIMLSHYCMRTWRSSVHGAWNLYGHSHGDLEDIGLQYDVGVDNNGYFPVSWDELKVIMANKKQIHINHHKEE